MRKTVNIVKKMRTTNCKISIFSGVTSDVCKIDLIFLSQKKFLFSIFTTKVGYVSMVMYICSLNVFCQGSGTSWGDQSLRSAPQKQ